MARDIGKVSITGAIWCRAQNSIIRRVLVDGDVSKRETAIKVIDAALKHFGRIDLLVNNAGIYMPKAFTDYTDPSGSRGSRH